MPREPAVGLPCLGFTNVSNACQNIGAASELWAIAQRYIYNACMKVCALLCLCCQCGAGSGSALQLLDSLSRTCFISISCERIEHHMSTTRNSDYMVDL